MADEPQFNSRPRLLDLFCGAGGAGMGYHRAGFDVTGVDIAHQPRYPFTFHQADAMTYELDGYDAIHASPPCQAYSAAVHPDARAGYPDLLDGTRRRLMATGVPWIIENVPGAPMRPDYVLCGCLFGLERLRRTRWFETSWAGFEMRSPCWHREPALTVTGTAAGSRGQVSLDGEHNWPTRAEAAEAMGIDWMNWRELTQAIPPAYTEHIGRGMIGALRAVA